MKIRFISLFSLLLFSTCLLLGCSITDLVIDYTDTYVEGQDSQENMIEYNCHKYYAESDSSVYFIKNGFLYVIDKAVKKCRPLCNKSDCLHDKETGEKAKCNAYLGTTDEVCLYYNKFIYFKLDETEKDNDGVVHSYECVRRISTENSEIQTVYRTEDYTIFDVKIHRGYLYLYSAKFGSDGTAQDDNAEFLRLNINSGTDPEVIVPMNQFRKQYKNMIVMDFRFYGNHIIFEILYLNGEEKITLINFDLESKEWSDLGDKANLKTDTFFTVFKNNIYYGNDGNIYKCNLNGENNKKVVDCKNLIKGYKFVHPYTNDGKNIIITAANDGSFSDKIIFCDVKGNATVKKMPFQYSATIGFDENAFYYMDDSEMLRIGKDDYKAEVIYKFPENE